MAHVFGKSSTRTSSVANPITTAFFTIEIGETVLVLMMKTVGATDRAGGAPVFAGLTMIQASIAQKAATSPEAGCEIWYLLDPPVGSWTATIPNTGALTIFYTYSTGRAKAGGKSVLDGVSGANNTSTNPAPGSITTTQDGDIGFAITAGGWQTWAPSAQVGTVISNVDDGAHGCGQQYHLQATLGAVNLGWTFATSEDWGAIAVYFKEVPPNSFNNYMGVRANSGMWIGEKIR